MDSCHYLTQFHYKGCIEDRRKWITGLIISNYQTFIIILPVQFLFYSCLYKSIKLKNSRYFLSQNIQIHIPYLYQSHVAT